MPKWIWIFSRKAYSHARRTGDMVPEALAVLVPDEGKAGRTNGARKPVEGKVVHLIIYDGF